MTQQLLIEVVYALPDRQLVIELELAPGATVIEAIEQSGILQAAGQSGADFKPEQLGIFAKKCTPDSTLCDGDRVEIYRPLKLSPTEARRLRAKTSAEKRHT